MSRLGAAQPARSATGTRAGAVANAGGWRRFNGNNQAATNSSAGTYRQASPTTGAGSRSQAYRAPAQSNRSYSPALNYRSAPSYNRPVARTYSAPRSQSYSTARSYAQPRQELLRSTTELLGPASELFGSTPELLGPTPDLFGSTPELLGPTSKLFRSAPKLLGPTSECFRFALLLWRRRREPELLRWWKPGFLRRWKPGRRRRTSPVGDAVDLSYGVTRIVTRRRDASVCPSPGSASFDHSTVTPETPNPCSSVAISCARFSASPAFSIRRSPFDRSWSRGTRRRLRSRLRSAWHRPRLR